MVYFMVMIENIIPCPLPLRFNVYCKIISKGPSSNAAGHVNHFSDLHLNKWDDASKWCSLFHGVVVQTPASKLVYVHPMMLCWISWCLSSCVYPQYGDSVSLREMFQTDVYYVYTYIYIYTHTRIDKHLMAETMMSCLIIRLFLLLLINFLP